MDRVSFFMIYCAIFGLVVNFAAAQTVHVVGDSMGWDIPPNTSASYSNWASAKTFMLGDILVFNFMTNQHDVVQVPKASYDDCSDDGAIGSVITAGPANITLNSAGDRYYICTIGRHCEAGQKLSITVVSSSTPQPNACAPSPNAVAPMPPARLTPPPPPPSASVALPTSFLLLIISVGLALIF
ncbi:cucumber peeling cupredoxin-like [Salvia miltiorrhiza]|uniref:cucumber peeling cupredoxin-like n=1 Tax=Salvia miltiorrhiza TaxID=226208 RepID=UPI0025AD9544|nr:cucumber peeling cupredoxin-like [Salvia miltiorrhiza]